MAATKGAASAATTSSPVGDQKTSEWKDSGYDSKCIFCRIANKEEKGTDFIYSDDDLTCFSDIRPGAPHHYLVVPKKHVGNCKNLNKEHVTLVEKMIEVGKTVLQQKQITDLEDTRFGFHWPPFCSITHLHLHVLAPASQMGFLSRMIYRIDSYWFVTADQLVQRLKTENSTS
ncbi:histidine triad nucleotide-binding protein 3 [Latimeria chalumnae]|uniref:Adenosine 5'-monophosphoramidase HINT3 n=1 Tax=Latimeria chalumnae TaxID=7897 RepID=H3AMV9_LATCH|nr:PREDICTED: histidine triad nucleotide-binding protein 3 [Latimeria chalumnae]|eukprot:XP_014348365.1 PREDICTED: histidine triad nucleotide-binding protein 3 [Latimeria chalumnae]